LYTTKDHVTMTIKVRRLCYRSDTRAQYHEAVVDLSPRTLVNSSIQPHINMYNFISDDYCKYV